MTLPEIWGTQTINKVLFKATQIERRQQYKASGCPTGACSHKAIDSDQTENLKTLFKRYLDGLSIDAAGCDIPLGRTCLGKMLKNPVYLGNDYYPQLIDADMFEAVQEERRRRYEAKGCPSKAAPLETVPIRTSFHIHQIKEKYADPKKQAEYVYGQIKNL